MTNFSGIAYHKKLLKILEAPLIPISSGMPSLYASGRQEDKLLTSLIAGWMLTRIDPFAIEEVAMDDMLAMPVIIVLAMNATKLC